MGPDLVSVETTHMYTPAQTCKSLTKLAFQRVDNSDDARGKMA